MKTTLLSHILLYNNLGEYVSPQIIKLMNLLNHKLDNK